MKFRGVAVDRVTLLNVEVTAEGNGRAAKGFGSMPLGNVWSFPSPRLSYEDTLALMKELAIEICGIVQDAGVDGHPIGMHHELEPRYLQAAGGLGPEAVPPLCTMVVASPFDLAIHDAYGKALGLNCYSTYDGGHMDYDLGYYLDDQFRGEFLDRYLSRKPAESLHLYHLVGALDALTGGDLKARLNDGYPETLEEWVRTEGVDHIKIKLDGDNLAWDVDRIISVDHVLNGIAPDKPWRYSLDFNERCRSVEYLLECLGSVRNTAPAAFARIQYLEQPTNRDLDAPGTPDMHEAAKIKPVVIDESLVSYQSLLRARELGYSGVALKACKGQSNALLMAAAAQKFGMFLCMQDLTCPGASLLESVGLAAHIPRITAVEGNARQYLPVANKGWEASFPGIFKVSDGLLRTSQLNGLGLGVVPAVVRDGEEHECNLLQQN